MMTVRFLRLAALALLSVSGISAQAADCPPTTIDPAIAPPGATVGSAYSFVFTASNTNASPFNYALTAGLPASSGLALNAGSGELTGTPTQVGSFLFTVTATDASGCSGGRIYPLTVAQGNQTISFTSAAPAATVGGPAYTVTATATSSLAVSFAIDAISSGVCAIAGNSVTFQTAGTCVINANQAGDANWNAAPQVQQSFAVGKADQTISFTSVAPTNASNGGATYDVTATATSGLAVAFTIDASAASVCSISGNTVSFIGVGTCVINANQAGDANWNAAPQLQQTFAVGKADQTISFTSVAPTNASNGGATYDVTATATSGLAVGFSIDASAAAVCTISGNTVSFIGAGTCVINANQAGDANWNAAPQVQQSFAVGKADQTISFTSAAPTNASIGGATYDVTATATSGLAVAFSIDASAGAVCTISGSTVSFIGGGTCVINANQAGDANWNAATQAQQSFAVAICIAPALGEVVTGSMPGNSSFCVLNGTGADMEFTYLPINNSPSTDVTIDVLGANIQAVTGPPSPRPEFSPLAPLQALPVSPNDSHVSIDTSAFPNGEIKRSALISSPSTIPSGPLTVGQLIDLNVSFACSGSPDVRKGRVEAITVPQQAGQQVLYAVQEVIDNPSSPGNWIPAVPGGFATVDFQNIIDSIVQAPPGSTPPASFSTTALLRTGALDLLTSNFGALTDTDGNNGVVIFFTPAINALSPPASSIVVRGQFSSKDVFGTDDCSNSNGSSTTGGEILYLMVPDPTGSVNSNVRTLPSVYGSAAITIAHHLQHLNNAFRRAHVTGASSFEQPWLDEALSFTLQELMFFNASVGLTPQQNVNLSNLTSGPSASIRVAAFNSFENEMFGAARGAFYQLGSSNGNKRFGPLRTIAHASGGHDQVAGNFATTFLFLRYAMDRKNTGDAGILNALTNSSLEGRANLQNAFAANIDDWARDFLVAMYADDAVTGVAANYTAPSWNYRSVYGGLGGFPLAVGLLSNNITSSGVIGTGGGSRYLRFGVAAGQTATITTTVAGGAPPPATVGTALIRTK